MSWGQSTFFSKPCIYFPYKTKLCYLLQQKLLLKVICINASAKQNWFSPFQGNFFNTNFIYGGVSATVFDCSYLIVSQSLLIRKHVINQRILFCFTVHCEAILIIFLGWNYHPILCILNFINKNTEFSDSSDPFILLYVQQSLKIGGL